MSEPIADVVDIRVDSVTRLVSDVLHSADCDDLDARLELPRSRAAFAQEFIALVVALGATVDIEDRSVDISELPTAGFLVRGTNIHVRLGRLSWTTALSLVPIVGGIVASGGLLPLLGAPPLLILLKDAITPLGECDKTIVVTVTALEKHLGRAVTAREVRDKIRRGDKISRANIDAALRRLASMGVLASTETGYRQNF